MALNIDRVLDDKCAVRCWTKIEAQMFFDELCSVFPELRHTADIKLHVYENLGNETTYTVLRGHGEKLEVRHCYPQWWLDRGYTVFNVEDVMLDLDLGVFDGNADINTLFECF